MNQPDVQAAALLFLLAVTVKTSGLEDGANVRLKCECLGAGTTDATGREKKRCKQSGFCTLVVHAKKPVR